MFVALNNPRRNWHCSKIQILAYQMTDDFKNKFAALVDKAAEALARGKAQKNSKLADLYKNLAQAYLRLAELTERHNCLRTARRQTRRNHRPTIGR
jgi:hypothetical protein